MSHVICYECGSTEHLSGYGLAAGPMGTYTICECGTVLEFTPDFEGMDKEAAARIRKEVDEWREDVEQKRASREAGGQGGEEK